MEIATAINPHFRGASQRIEYNANLRPFSEKAEIGRERVRERVFSLLPIRRSLLTLILEPGELETAERVIRSAVAAGTMGLRECPVTGGEVITDRRQGPRVSHSAPKTEAQKRQHAAILGVRHGR